MPQKTIQIATRVDREKAERIEEIAAAEDRTIASVLRRALEREITLFDEKAAA